MPNPESLPFSLPLLLDASSPTVHVGIPGSGGWRTLFREEGPALETLFTGLSECHAQTDSSPCEIDAILFCEGPGSTLGLRIAATVAKTIMSENVPVPALLVYNALDLATRLAPSPEHPILAPFRNGFHLMRRSIEDSPFGEIEILGEEQVASLAPDCLRLPGRRILEDADDGPATLAYDLSSIRGFADLAPILRPAPSPEVFSPQPAEFRKWKPDRNLSPQG